MKKKNKKTDTSMAHILYQKLGNNWYAFTEVDGDCFVAKTDDEYVSAKISDDKNRNSPAHDSRKKGNA